MTYWIRVAQSTDAAVIGHHRRAMFEDMGTEGDMETMEREFCVWVEEKITQGQYIGWFALNEHDEVIAGAGARMDEWAAGPLIPHTHIRPYLMNVYVEPDYRRQGIAHLLIETIIAWAREQKYSLISLHASQFGRPLYEKLGFSSTNEMRLIL